MIRTTPENFQANLDQLMDKVVQEDKVLLIERKDGGNGVIVSPERWRKYQQNLDL